jgi:hypothetical protein
MQKHGAQMHAINRFLFIALIAALSIPAIGSQTASSASEIEAILRSAKTFLVQSKTVDCPAEYLEKEFAKEKDFAGLGLAPAGKNSAADIVITVDRPQLTYAYTYLVADVKTSMVLYAGKVTAIDGFSAASKIARKLVDEWKTIRSPTPRTN